MRKAGIAELKASLSEYLAAVKAGEEVLVTEHGRPVARIVPLTVGSDLPPGVEELVRSGILRPPQRALDRQFWKLRRPADPERASLAALLAERDEGR